MLQPCRIKRLNDGKMLKSEPLHRSTPGKEPDAENLEWLWTGASNALVRKA